MYIYSSFYINNHGVSQQEYKSTPLFKIAKLTVLIFTIIV